jgi:hypothetical protein
VLPLLQLSQTYSFFFSTSLCEYNSTMADNAKEYRKALREGDFQKAKGLMGTGVDNKQFLDDSPKPYVLSLSFAFSYFRAFSFAY